MPTAWFLFFINRKRWKSKIQVIYLNHTQSAKLHFTRFVQHNIGIIIVWDAMSDISLNLYKAIST